MARVRRRGGAGAKPRGGSSVEVPGLYARLLEHERQVVQTPDPRWKYTDSGRLGERCPPRYLRKSLILAALERGERVRLPGWTWHAGDPTFAQLGPAIPGLRERCGEWESRDGSIVGWFCYADDTLIPYRGRRGR